MITAGGDRTQKVLKKASTPETVTTTGNPVIQGNDDGSKTYTFLGGGTGSMRVLSRTGNVVHENRDYESAYEVTYTVSSADTVKYQMYTKGSSGTYYPWAGGTLYVNYKKSTLAVTGVDTGSGSAQLKFTPNAPGGDGGSVTVVPSTPEETTDQKFGYFTHIPASAESQERTFLVQQSTAVQNFAFDGMDDLDIDFEQ